MAFFRSSRLAPAFEKAGQNNSKSEFELPYKSQFINQQTIDNKIQKGEIL
jgi:hypothetical protein